MKPEVVPTEKLQKVLARAGFGSRREIEVWIQQGRVKVNTQVATLGARVCVTDDIRVDGRRVGKSELKEQARQIICYHKPTGEVCTRHDPEGRTTIFGQLPSLKQGRWINVGRLDLNTSGLLLLTTDGKLANQLMHPSYKIEREYAVRVLGEVDKSILQRLQDGVQLEDGKANFLRINIAGGKGANHWYNVILTEGRKHEVRRLWESQGITVSRLIRIRFGPITLPRNLHAGNYIKLDNLAQQKLLKAVNNP
ncbi:pseudouridine synthase [Candidatus Halobeggiatoa sp. HSG11]|nr:pseudouridine synthase [Candidatus Halobeggiatoa sp. HSG11]